MEKRKLDKTRELIDRLLSEGWVIEKRVPLTLRRGLGTAEVKPNGFVVYG